MFSTYQYPARSSVPQPPVHPNTLGTVNPSFSTISTSSIGGKMQGEYIVSEMDAKQHVAQYTPIVQSIPCKVEDTTRRIYPKGTLVLFSDLPAATHGIHTSSTGPMRSRLSEPVPISKVTFNTKESREEKHNVGVAPKILLPLSESTEIYQQKSQYIAVSVKDAGEIFVPAGNESVTFKPGDTVYATLGANGVYHISADRGQFQLGISMLQQSFDSSHFSTSQNRSLQVALCPRKL